jgi:protein ImuB
MGHAPFTRIVGPYVVSGGWWVREVYREYHFAETESGKIVWVYFDKKRRRWFVHGEVS